MSTLSGTVTSAASGTLTDSTASFYTTGDGLAGVPVAVRSPSGAWQWRRIASNTATELTLDTTNDASWQPTPSAGWTYLVGGIEWYQWTPVVDDGDPFEEKKQHHLYLEVLTPSPSAHLEVQVRPGAQAGVTMTLDVAWQGGGAIWGDPGTLWGTALWGGAPAQQAKREIGQTVIAVQYQFRHYTPDERLVVLAWGRTSDAQPRRRAPVV
jgi:hypothetical protein